MSRLMRWLRCTAAPVLGGLCFPLAWSACTPSDPAAAPELSSPPALVDSQSLGERTLLFDTQTTTGWKVEGPHRVDDGTLELGGEEATRAILQRSIDEGERVEFDFFQKGSAGATLALKPTLIHPEPPDPDFIQDISFDLNLSGFLYQQWHTVRIGSGRDGDNSKVTINVEAHHDGPGKGGGAIHSMPARGGCLYQLVFDVAPGARLYLRNVLVGDENILANEDSKAIREKN